MQVEKARQLVYDKNEKDLLYMLVGVDSITKRYILDHYPNLSNFTDEKWIEFEDRIINSRLLNVIQRDAALVQTATQWVNVLHDNFINSDEQLWRLWLCLWVVGFKDVWHASTCLAYIMESCGISAIIFNSVDVTIHSSIAIGDLYDETKFVDNQHCRPIFFERFNDSVRVYGCKTDLILTSYEQPLKFEDAYRDMDVYTIVKMLQQVGIRPSNRIINKLRFRRYRLANDKDV